MRTHQGWYFHEEAGPAAVVSKCPEWGRNAGAREVQRSRKQKGGIPCLGGEWGRTDVRARLQGSAPIPLPPSCVTASCLAPRST